MNNRILTIDEITAGGSKPLWYQGRYCRFTEPVMYMYEHIPIFKFKVLKPDKSDRHIKADPKMYGLTWRCWEKRPNEDDMAQRFELIEREVQHGQNQSEEAG